jgi:hypothetical protein
MKKKINQQHCGRRGKKKPMTLKKKQNKWLLKQLEVQAVTMAQLP